jgi:hypothetical protein
MQREKAPWTNKRENYQDTSTSVATSFQRFAVTALAGFASNEAMFVLSRFWAFER